MSKKRFHFSSFFVSIGVVLITLVAGTTYTAYQRDLGLLKAEGAGQFSTELNSIVRQFIRFEGDLVEFSETQSATAKYKLETRSKAVRNQIDDLRLSSKNFTELPEDGEALLVSMADQISNVETKLATNSDLTWQADVKIAQELSFEVEEFVQDVAISESASNAQVQESIKKSARNSILLSFLTVMLSILGMAYFIRLNAQNEMMASNNKKLAERAAAGSEAKSRLLTMLSHEIRTPMNGVLGLVSLGLQQKLPDGQRKLMEQIRSSALELITFLEDMLDFSSLESLDDRQEHSLLFTSNIMQNLDDRLRASFTRQGKSLEFVPDSELPKLLRGDTDRIQQSLFYLLSYISKNSFDENIIVKSTIFEDKWLWRIDLEADASLNQDWQINSLVGKGVGDSFIASDTIETAMGRGLIESMQGEIRLVRSNINKEKYRLLVYIPIQTIAKKKPLQILKHPANSTNIRLGDILGSVAYDELEDYQVSQAEMVLCDPACPSELRKLTDLRSASPKARIVSVGPTQFGELYDDVYLRANFNTVHGDDDLAGSA